MERRPPGWSGLSVSALGFGCGTAGGLLEQAHSHARDFTHGRLLAAMEAALELESVYELALRYALSKPGIACGLVGFPSLQQLEQAIAWEARGPLSTDAVCQVLSLSAA